MRIDRLEIENFKKYEHLVLDLHPQFTLLVGENGSGKTTVLDALAVASSVWLHRVPDSAARRSRRDIRENERRMWSESVGDRLSFRVAEEASVSAWGPLVVGSDVLHWKFSSVLDSVSVQIPGEVAEFFEREAVERLLVPIVGLYSAERATPAQHDSTSGGPALRWAAFSGSLNGTIDAIGLTRWFQRESIERGNRQGRWRPGFDIVRRAILRCVPGATDVRYDGDRFQIVLNIDGNIQPFENLSAGQATMLALVADLAIKCVTQNAYLIPPDELPPDELPEVLKQTPGLVLIDELDVHLHPRWQRRIAHDLKATFPAIQFVCTSHSPQIIGQLKPEEIRILKGDQAYTPPRSFGIDSNRILEELMDAEPRDESVNERLGEMFQAIDDDDLESAREKIAVLQAELGEDEPEIIRARTLMRFLESDI